MVNKNKTKKNFKHQNLLGKSLKVCSKKPLTGWFRNGFCQKDEQDYGKHTVCAKLDKKFMDFSKSNNNDLYGVANPGDKWCICEDRWLEAYQHQKNPKVILSATNSKLAKNIKKKILKRKKSKKKVKQQFLYNPEDPSKSFDVYINKNPSDTISIKYTTVEDVKNTILKLEDLYKKKKYSHKRIWQVGMILKVRLEAMKKHQKTRYPNAKKVNERFRLANKYFKFLGQRTKLSEKKRYQSIFKI